MPTIHFRKGAHTLKKITVMTNAISVKTGPNTLVVRDFIAMLSKTGHTEKSAAYEENLNW